MGAAKVAVTVPTSLLEAIEAERHRTGETRSQIVQRAVELLLERSSIDEEADRQYAEAYRKYPETDEEVEAFSRGAMEALRAVRWED